MLMTFQFNSIPGALDFEFYFTFLFNLRVSRLFFFGFKSKVTYKGLGRDKGTLSDQIYWFVTEVITIEVNYQSLGKYSGHCQCLFFF